MCIADEFDKEDYSGNWKWQRKTEYPVAYDFKTICFFCLKFVNKCKKCVLLMSIKTYYQNFQMCEYHKGN